MTLDRPGKKPRTARERIAFDDNDFEGTSQPHNDTFAVTLRIGGFLVKRVMINQGNGIEIMYPSLYKGLDLKFEDLGKMVVPKGQIRFPIVAKGKEVMENFIMVNAFSPYTMILA